MNTIRRPQKKKWEKLGYRLLYFLAPRRAQARILRHTRGVSASYYAGYLRTCRRAATDDQAFSNFKRDSDYMRVLEQPLEEFGRDCFKMILRRHRSVIKTLPWQKLRANDELGDPTVFDRTDVMGKHVPLENFYFSSTTIRYIYYALEIIAHYGKICPGKKNLDVIELGGGYGGQCWMLSAIAPALGLTIRSYFIVDLEEPCLLQERYLNALGAEGFECISSNEVERRLADVDCDLLVANYSLGEFPFDIQDFYLDVVVPRARHGFLLWNLTPLHPRFNRNAFPLLKIRREVPRTGPSITVTY